MCRIRNCTNPFHSLPHPPLSLVTPPLPLPSTTHSPTSLPHSPYLLPSPTLTPFPLTPPSLPFSLPISPPPPPHSPYPSLACPSSCVGRREPISQYRPTSLEATPTNHSVTTPRGQRSQAACVPTGAWIPVCVRFPFPV